MPRPTIKVPAVRQSVDSATVVVPSVSEIPKNYRVVLLVVSLSLLGIFVTARCLRPDPAGFGTHRQLGLRECTMVRLLNRPCPSCGMTTAWAWLVRGNVSAATTANLGGLVMGILGMAVVPWAAGSALAGRWLLVKPRQNWLIATAVVIVIVILVDWVQRCWIR
jgi:hypothetical protein